MLFGRFYLVQDWKGREEGRGGGVGGGGHEESFVEVTKIFV